MTKRFKERLIAAFTFFGGLYFFLEYVLPEKVGDFEFGKYHDQISTGLTVIGVMAIGLGIINLLGVHGTKLLRLKAGWFNSAALLIGLWCALAFDGLEIYDAQEKAQERKVIDGWAKYTTMIADDIGGQRLAEARAKLLILRTAVEAKEIAFHAEPGSPLFAHYSAAREHLQSLGKGETFSGEQLKALEDDFQSLAALLQQHNRKQHEATFAKRASGFLYQGFFVPLGSAMFALLAFYIAAAAYRSFRVKSLDALVMMISALVVMLGQIPHGPLYISPNLPEWRLWLLQNVSTPAFRAIYFGSAIAGLAMAVRMWLSLERSPLAASDDNESGEAQA